LFSTDRIGIVALNISFFVSYAFLILCACSVYCFLSLFRTAVAAMAISMITALISAVVIMFVFVCFDIMPINAQTMTRP
jgi:hypothetical protein